LSTKQSEEMFSGAWASNYCVWKGTILHIQYQSLPITSEAVVLQFDPATRTNRTISALGPNVFNLNVSPDGHWMLFTRRNTRSDLVLVEGGDWILHDGARPAR
jgi:hypothetical protein